MGAEEAPHDQDTSAAGDPAFRSPDALCPMRSYVRQRGQLIRDRSRAVQHLQKALTQMNVQLDNVLSDIMGKTGQLIVRAIVAGERDGAALAKFRDGRCKADETTIAASLRGTRLRFIVEGERAFDMGGGTTFTPSASGRGLTLSIAPAWGRTGSATERLWSAHDATALGADGEFEADSQLAIDAGYGIGFAGNRGVLTPYVGMTLGDSGNRTVRTGTRW